MGDFIITDNGWIFDLEQPVRKDLPKVVMDLGPIFGTAAQWANYNDTLLYELEVLLRKWFDVKMKNKHWVHSCRDRRYTTAMIIEELYGEPYDQKKFSRHITRLNRLLPYYSSKIQKQGYINNKKYSKTIYSMSPSRRKRIPPYSLKLRIEWLAEQGLLPNESNMRCAADDLKPGQARNPKTQEMMDKRRRAALDKFNERYNKDLERGRKH